ncbi:MAG: TetR/AcrR family transcriptional regulator [Myxococcales bacterium]|nr:TetR/AcrR family transcriptional regulator [Myxococcales bacterium]
MAKPSGSGRLDAAAWERAALDAIARGGLSAVAVEPLAAALGVSKGSFYWHFADRDALVVAALARWESAETVETIAALERLPDARERMTAVLRAGLSGELGGAVDAALLADADDPLVAPALQRVTRARLRYTTRLFAQLGVSRGEARQRALLAYAAYVGHFALQRAAPSLLPRDRAARCYADHVIGALVPSPRSRRRRPMAR